MAQSIYYEEGFSAALVGKKIDDCKLQKPVRRNDWVRGFQEGVEKTIDKRLTDKEKQEGKKQIKKLKESLNIFS